MISIAEAVSIVNAETFLLEAETVDLDLSIGRILAEEIRADMDLPPFNRSQMDGFAVSAANCFHTFALFSNLKYYSSKTFGTVEAQM